MKGGSDGQRRQGEAELGGEVGEFTLKGPAVLESLSYLLACVIIVCIGGRAGALSAWSGLLSNKIWGVDWHIPRFKTNSLGFSLLTLEQRHRRWMLPTWLRSRRFR